MSINFITEILVAVIALLHLYFLVLEMFLWDKGPGLRAFGHSIEQATRTKKLAMNQGLYNGFLAAGLLVGLYKGGQDGFHFQIFFLSCVIVAGIFGAITVSRKIFFIQALPALVALVLLHLD